MRIDPFIRAYALAFKAQTQIQGGDWITISVRILAAQFTARPLKLSVAMLRHEKAFEHNLIAIGRERPYAKRALLHARAHLYAAMLAEPTLLPVYEKAYPEGPPLEHSKFLSNLERANAVAVNDNRRIKYRRTKEELRQIEPLIDAAIQHTKHTRQEFERARRAFHIAKAAHEESLLVRRGYNEKARAAGALIVEKKDAQAAHTHARTSNRQAQLQLSVLKQRQYRLRHVLQRLRTQLI